MVGDDTAEVRVLNWSDIADADDSDDDDKTAQVLVDLPPDDAAESSAEVASTPEKTINIQQGGLISAVRVKLSMAGGAWGAAKWRLVRNGGTLAIRVDLGLSLPQLTSTPVPDAPQAVEPPAGTPHWILWVLLDRRNLVDAAVRLIHRADSSEELPPAGDSASGTEGRRDQASD